jgi:hypothetical protein
MVTIQNCDSYINLPSSQTLVSLRLGFSYFQEVKAVTVITTFDQIIVSFFSTALWLLRCASLAVRSVNDYSCELRSPYYA